MVQIIGFNFWWHHVCSVRLAILQLHIFLKVILSQTIQSEIR